MSRFVRSDKVIVSLTTHPGRIKTTHLAIKSILSQEVKCDLIRLNVAMDDFPSGIKDKELLHLFKKGLIEIKYTNDYGPATKLLPTMKEHPKALIITIDDDRIYEPQLIKKLLECHFRHPECIVCPVAKQLTENWFAYGCEPHNKLKQERFLPGCFEGFAGVLYPPDSLHSDVYKWDLAKGLCPFADDIWFVIQAFRQGTSIVSTNDPKLIWPKEIDETQDHALWKYHIKADNIMLWRTAKHYNLTELFIDNNVCKTCRRIMKLSMAEEPLTKNTQRFCSECLNTEKKRVLFIGCYDYGNLGDESYKKILSHFFGEEFECAFIPDVVRINKNKQYIPLTSNEEDWEWDALVIGGGCMLYNWNSNNSIMYYVNNRLHRPYYLISCGFTDDNVIDLKYIKEARLISVRSVKDLILLNKIDNKINAKLYPDLGYLIEQVHVPFCYEKKWVCVLQTGSCNVQIKSVRDLIDEKLQEYKGSRLIIINTGGMSDPTSKHDSADSYLFEDIKNYYPDAIVKQGASISTDLKECYYKEEKIRESDISLEELIYTIKCSNWVITGRFHGIVFSRALGIPYTNLVWNHKNCSEEEIILDHSNAIEQIHILKYLLLNDNDIKHFIEWSEDDRNFYITQLHLQLNSKKKGPEIPLIQALNNETIYQTIRYGGQIS